MDSVRGRCYLHRCIASIHRLVRSALSPTNSYTQTGSLLPLMVKLHSRKRTLIVSSLNPQRGFTNTSSGPTRAQPVVLWETIRRIPLPCTSPWTHLSPVVLTLYYNSYQYDIDPVTQSFKNRRVFAYSDSGIPDGIQPDTNGNVFSGCGDGVQVWNSAGTLIGKFLLNSTTPEMMFTKSGLLIFKDEMIYLADIQAQGIDLIVY